MTGAARTKAVKIAAAGLGALVAAAVLAAAGAVWWVAATEGGTARLVAWAADASDGRLRIGSASGTLLGGLELRDVEIRGGRERILVDAVALEWRPEALLAREIAFARVAADRVEHRRLEDAPAGTAGRLDLPFAVTVAEASVEQLAIAAGDRALALEAVRGSVRFADGRLALGDLAARLGGFELGGRAALGLREALDLDAEIAWTGTIAGQAAAGEATVTGTWPTLAVRHEFAAPFRASAAGTLRLDGEPRVDVVAEWQEAAWPGLAAVTSPTGRLELAGSAASFGFSARASVVVEGVPAEVTAQGTGAGPELAFESLEVATPHGQLTATGRLAADTLAVEAEFVANEIDPAAISAEWSGNLFARGRLDGAWRPAPEWRLVAEEVHGELRGYPVDAGGVIVRRDEAWALADVRIVSGANAVEASGRIAEELDLAVAARLDDLGLAWPGLRGALTGDLTITGPAAAPRVAGAASGRDLGYGRWFVGRLEASGSFGGGADGAVTVTGEDVRGGRVAADAVRMTLAGTPSEHRLVLAAEAPRWRLDGEAAGGLAEGGWRGTLARLAVDQPALGQWRLDEPAALRVGPGRTALETACLTQDGARVCAEVTLEGAPTDSLVLSAQNFALEALEPLLPPNVSLAGVWQLSASFTELATVPRGSLALVGGATRVSTALAELEQPLVTEIDEVLLRADLADWQLTLDAHVRAAEGGTADVTAAMADVRTLDSPVEGELRVLWPDLGVAALLSPDVGHVAGSATVELDVRGTAAEPAVHGRARLDGGEVSVPDWGLVIEGITAEATSTDGSELEFVASGRVGDGEVRLRGVTELDYRAGWPTELTLTGEGVHAVQRPDLDVFVSPDLHVSARLPDITVTGTVHVPRARVAIAELPEQAISPSPDAVVHGVQRVEPRHPLRMVSDLVITLGEDVTYSGQNLTADVSGEMRLRRDSDLATVASGSLRLEGSYNAYGQTLRLDRGQLLFTGPLDDPALDVRAVRTIDETRTVGIELSGTVKAPRTRIYSEPPVSEADALSYLLFGRPVTGTGGEETATLETAAVAMGLQQALPVVQRIGRSLGLDELTVQTTDADAGALMAGKYLSPKVYIRYSYGLFNRIGGLLLRFRVNERLSIETRSGDQKSMDLLYTVEKD
ncbi:MAG TPA: translocation/assembly module TamB domain-containing protein [Gammaproteobacteria bacterium]